MFISLLWFLRSRCSVLFGCAVLLVSVLASNALGQVTRSFTEPVEERTLAIPQPQLITELFVKEGQVVREGEILAELDNEVLKERLNVAKIRATSRSRFKAAKAKVDIQQAKLNALLDMKEQGFANVNEIRNAHMMLAEYKANAEYEQESLSQYEAEARQIEAEIEQKIIRSPLDGIITEINRQEGEIVSSGEAMFAKVANLSQLRVRYYLTYEVVKNLREGQPVSLELQITGQRIRGTVDFISPIISPDSGTARVEVLVNNPELKILSGLPCRWIHSQSNLSRLDELKAKPVANSRQKYKKPKPFRL